MDGDYIGTGVIARGVGLDAHVHADPEQLLITSIVARLRQGGQLEGDVVLDIGFLPVPRRLPSPATGQGRRVGAAVRPEGRRYSFRPPPRPSTSRWTARSRRCCADVSLDTLAGHGRAAPPYQRLGIDAHRSTARPTPSGSRATIALYPWVGRTFLNLSPSGQPRARR